jgi:toxin CptA
MHSAPSVSYPVGRSRFAAGLLLVMWLFGAAATAAWTIQVQLPVWWRGGAWLLLAAAGAFAAWHWWRGPRGILGWDGQGWNWSGSGAAAAGVPQVGLDLQYALLLRCCWDGQSRWLWLERASRPERWDDLRRAVYSRARAQALPDARAPAAKP